MKPDDAVRFTSHKKEAVFREMLSFTEARTGFDARLVEKDYFCSQLLQFLSGMDAKQLFKGGTCLSKVYMGFFRLSEDLDFTIPVSPGANRF